MLEWKQIIILFVLFFHEVKIIHGTKELQNIVTERQTHYDTFGEAKILLLSTGKLVRIVNFEAPYDSGNYFLHINSLHPRESNSTCKIPVESGKGEVYAVGLGNGNIVARLSSYEIVIINTTLCTNITFFYDKGIHAVFPYHDTFDFLDDAERCSKGQGGCVYRYNDAGNLIQIFDNIQLSSYFVNRRFGMFKAYTPSENYFIIRHLQDRLTAIDVLNSTFNKVNTHKLYHSIKAYSTEFGDFSLCYTKYDLNGPYDEILQCKILDWKFNTRVNVTAIKHYKYIHSIAMHNLRDGGAIVVYCIPKYVGSCHVYYLHIDASGNVEKEDTLVEEFGVKDVNIYIFEADTAAKTYCIVLSSWALVSEKCINVL